MTNNILQSDEDIQKRAYAAYTNLSKQYEVLNETKKEMQTKITNINSDIEKLISNIRKYDMKNKQKTQNDKEKEKLNEQIIELENQKSADDNQLFEKGEYLKSIVQELCKERRKRAKAVQKKKEVIFDLQNMTNAVQTLKEQPSSSQIYNELSNQYKKVSDGLNKKQEKKNEQIETMKREYEAAVQDSKSKEQQFKDISNEINEIEGRIIRRDETVSIYEHDIQDLGEQRDGVVAEIDKLDSAKSGLEISIERVSQQLSKVQQRAVNIANKYKEENAKNKQLAKFLISFNNECDQKIKALSEELEQDGNKEIQKIDESMKSKENEIKILQNKISEFVAETNSMLNKIDEMEKEKQNETDQLAQLNEKSKILFGAMQQIMCTITSPDIIDASTVGREQ